FAALGGEAPGGELTGEIALPVPGAVRFGDWRIEARAGDAQAGGPRVAESVGMPAALAHDLTVRTRRPGDRMRPLGLGGAKSLQDLFVDHKIPRRLRDAYPLVCAAGGEQILWIPGVAISEICGPRPRDGAAWITATRV
ncbi:MAG: tRNA lysidine(34) synthetase TilS, partial [Thermoleophilia bacterium]|nr:tRNA lysidine(34) synthetase TilS [Thermoleophilia bacterium]